MFWAATESLGYPYGPLLQLLLLTGQRKSEVAEMEWKEVDLDRRLWRIPAERFKSDETHLVPLCDDSYALLKTLPRFDHGDFVFSTTFGRVPVNGFSKAKGRLDALMGAGVTPWVIHDLRRTVRTRLSSLRIEDHVAEMVIGHGRQGNQRVYDQHKYLQEIREALCRWEAELREMITWTRKSLQSDED